MSKGRDTIGRGGAHTGPRSDINSTPGDIRQGDRKLGRDYRSNTVSGHDKHSGPSADKGAALVAKVMAKAERGAVDGDRLGEPPGVRFRIGDNQAKTIDHDAPPK